MKASARFILALTVAALIMLAFRALAFTLYSVGGNSLEPELLGGDRVLVNRWSYGLRTGSRDGLFRYGRICRSEVERGDIVAFDSPLDSVDGVFVCRCRSLPGDTIRVNGDLMLVPGLVTCADENYYWMEAIGTGNTIDSRVFGFVPESSIIGRVCLVVFSHDDCRPFYTGYRPERTLLLK